MRVRDAITAVAGSAAVGVSVLGVGGALRGVQATVAVLIAICVAAQLTSRRRFDRLPVLIVVLGLALLLTGMQLIPLPDGVLAALNPVGHELRAQGESLANVTTWPVASMDPVGTANAFAFLVILLGGAFVALRWSASERGRFGLIRLVAATCGLAALVAGAHELVGAEALYGVYGLASGRPSLLGPFVNENHMASLMAVGFVTSAALSMDRRALPTVRVLWICNAVACLIANIATGSRGGFLALLAGSIVTTTVLIGQRLFSDEDRATRRRNVLTRSLPLAVIALCAMLVVVYLSASSVSQQISGTTLDELSEPRSKFAAWRSSTQLISESPWIGIGRGAFEPAFTRVHPASSLATFSHLENEYVQAVVEWGIPGAVILALAIAWLIVVVLRRWKGGVAAAASIGGLSVLALQSNVDFGVQMLGIALPGIFLVSTLTYVPVSVARPGGVVRGALVVVLVAAAVGLVVPHTRTIAEDHRQLTSSTSVADIRASVERHPLDYLAFARLGERMIRDRDPRAVSFINHALRLHPTHPGLHLIAARFLYRAGRRVQAALEYKTVVRNQTDPTAVVREIVRAFRDVPEAVSALPLDDSRVDLIVAALREEKRTDVAIRWLLAKLDANPGDTENCDLLFRLTLASGDVTTAEVVARRCPAQVNSPQRKLALARLMFERKAYSETISLLRDVAHWSGHIDEVSSAWLLLCDAYEATRQWEDARRCLRSLDGRGLSPRTRAAIDERIKNIERKRRELDLRAGSGVSAPL